MSGMNKFDGSHGPYLKPTPLHPKPLNYHEMYSENVDFY